MGFPPMGLIRSNVISSPAIFCKSMQRTIGISLDDCLRMVVSASAWVGNLPVKRLSVVLRCMLAANNPADWILIACGLP